MLRRFCNLPRVTVTLPAAVFACSARTCGPVELQPSLWAGRGRPDLELNVSSRALGGRQSKDAEMSSGGAVEVSTTLVRSLNAAWTELRCA
jgi:hypothetical protein